MSPVATNAKNRLNTHNKSFEATDQYRMLLFDKIFWIGHGYVTLHGISIKIFFLERFVKSVN